MKGCRSCHHWQEQDQFLDRIDPATANQKVQIGRCRRYAPRPNIVPAASGGDSAAVNGLWPQVASDDWCGEWEPEFK